MPYLKLIESALHGISLHGSYCTRAGERVTISEDNPKQFDDKTSAKNFLSVLRNEQECEFALCGIITA